MSCYVNKDFSIRVPTLLEFTPTFALILLKILIKL